MSSSEGSADLLPRLSTFVVVVEAGGFAAAARRLGTTRSAVSKQVALLEQEWGVKLLRRTTRSVSLTEPGQRAYGHASQIPRLAALAEESPANLSRAPKGRLRATASAAFGQHAIVPLLPAFRERHPHVEVELALLRETEAGYARASSLIEQRHQGGIASGLDLARAQAQLEAPGPSCGRRRRGAR